MPASKARAGIVLMNAAPGRNDTYDHQMILLPSYSLGWCTSRENGNPMVRDHYNILIISEKKCLLRLLLKRC